MMLKGTPILQLIFVVLALGAGVLVIERDLELASVSTVSTETPTPSPTETPTPESTPTPSLVASPKASPKINPRVAYVQQQLLAQGLDAAWVKNVFSDSRVQVYPIKTVAYKEPNWQLIKDKLYSATYVQMGKDYVQAHQATFDTMERDYGIPAGIIVGIIALETEFGKNTGSTPTFNALYSRLHQWPEDKWQGQAAQLIALAKHCSQAQLDCFTIKGSYAGAMGIVQFMPYSLLAYGIDGNKDGKVDLLNPVDAIPSAANFLKGHGWDENQSTALARYYGNPVGYPEIALHYASLLSQ